MNEEELNYLLHSENIEDVILGCRIAAEHFGEEWCKGRFRNEKLDSDRNRINCNNNGSILMKFNTFYIWIYDYIEYHKNPPKMANVNVLSFETPK